ncbi:MAG: hypothetical protein WBE34_05795 [Candidatus Nitrosopolaris sp.]
MNVQGIPIPIVIEVVDVAASSNECNHNKKPQQKLRNQCCSAVTNIIIPYNRS